MPFVQGQLRAEYLSFSIDTECAHCQQPIHIDIDSELKYQVVQEGCKPLVFAPQVDLQKLRDPSIIDAF